MTTLIDPGLAHDVAVLIATEHGGEQSYCKLWI